MALTRRIWSPQFTLVLVLLQIGVNAKSLSCMVGQFATAPFGRFTGR